MQGRRGALYEPDQWPLGDVLQPVGMSHMRISTGCWDLMASTRKVSASAQRAAGGDPRAPTPSAAARGRRRAAPSRAWAARRWRRPPRARGCRRRCTLRSRPRPRRGRCGAASAGARRAARRRRRPIRRCTSGAARRPRAWPRSSVGAPRGRRVPGEGWLQLAVAARPWFGERHASDSAADVCYIAPGARAAAFELPLLHAGLPVAAQALRLRTCALAARPPDRHSYNKRGRLLHGALRALQKRGPPARRLAVAELLLPRNFGLVFRALHAFGGGAPARTYAGVARGLAARGAAAALRELLANVSGTLGDDEWDQVRRPLRALERAPHASPPAAHGAGGVLHAPRRQAACWPIACVAKLLDERPDRAARAAWQVAACCDPSELARKPVGLKRARRNMGACGVRRQAALPCKLLAVSLAPQARACALPSAPASFPAGTGGGCGRLCSGGAAGHGGARRLEPRRGLGWRQRGGRARSAARGRHALRPRPGAAPVQDFKASCGSGAE